MPYMCNARNILISRGLHQPKNLSKSSISCEAALSHLEIDFAKYVAFHVTFSLLSVLIVLDISYKVLFDVLKICLCHLTQDADNLV